MDKEARKALIRERRANRPDWQRYRKVPDPVVVRTSKKPVVVRAVPVCGTTAAYRRHYRLGETPCLPCKEAFNSQARSKYQTKTRTSGKAPAQCGTPSGANRHRNLDEPVCPECKKAVNEQARINYAKRLADGRKRNR